MQKLLIHGKTCHTFLFSSHAPIYVVRDGVPITAASCTEVNFSKAECNAKNSFANSWGRWPKDDSEEKAEVLKPFLALVCTGTTCSPMSVCTSTIWQGKGQSAVVEQRRDPIVKLDIFK